MASLKKRGGTYYLQWYLPGKKQRRRNLETDSRRGVDPRSSNAPQYTRSCGRYGVSQFLKDMD
jgi:hypothetical protein